MRPLASVEKLADERCGTNPPERPMFDKQGLSAGSGWGFRKAAARGAALPPRPGSGRENGKAAVRPPLSSGRSCPPQALMARAGRLKNKATLFRVSYRVAMAEQSS